MNASSVNAKLLMQNIIFIIITYLFVLKFQGNAGHIRVVPCGPKVFVRARDNLCLMWTEPLTQGAQR